MRRRPPEDLLRVLALKEQGKTDREVAASTGVPVNTIRLWRRKGASRAAELARAGIPLCSLCEEPVHDFGALPARIYGYLLGIYLGDGCLAHVKTTWSLRISLDTAYPGIIAECADAVAELRGRPATVQRMRHENCAVVSSMWRRWICLFPQHGPGKKHTRSIALADWQRALLERAPGAFLRGLIHSDGWRGTNRVVVKGKAYEYPRYQFSNRSDDIRKLFTDACDLLGIEWKPWTRYHISLAKRDSVALLDTFVGPKH